MPAKSTPYNPARRITIPGNGEEPVLLQGKSAGLFGFTRILPYCSNMMGITVTAELNNEFTIFKDVHLATIRQFFLNNELLGPYVIQEEQDLLLTLKNTTGGDLDANVQILGYDAPAMERLKSLYSQRGIPMPKPNFLYANEEIAADATNQVVEVPTKSVDLDLVRMAIRTSNDDDISASLQIYNETVKNQLFVQQINDEFDGGYQKVPIPVKKKVPFSILASNSDAGNARDFSFLGEAYIAQ